MPGPRTLVAICLLAASCGGESQDGLAEIERLVADGSAAAAERLDEIYRSGEKETHEAAARAIVTLGEAALARGEKDAAAAKGLSVYLSSATADARLRAFRLYVRGAGERALERVAHIVDGRLDRDYLRHLPELLQEIPGEKARTLEARLEALWKN